MKNRWGRFGKEGEEQDPFRKRRKGVRLRAPIGNLGEGVFFKRGEEAAQE